MERHDLCYHANRWQRSLADRARKDNERLTHAETTGTEYWPATPSLTDEFFARMYSERVPEVPDEDRAPEASLAKQLHEQVEALPEWDNLARATRYNPFWSGIGTAAMMEEVLPVLKKHHDDLKEQGMQQRIPSWVAARMEQEAKDAGDEEGAAAALAQVQAAEASELFQPEDTDIRIALRAGIERALEEVQEAKEVEAALWGSQPGTIQPSTDRSLENPTVGSILKDPRFREILRMAGRLTSIARNKRRSRVDYARTEISDVTINGDISRALPSEWLRLKHPRLRKLFLKDYVEHRLLSYKLTGKDKTARGPVTLLVDVSGSMHRAREVWAKGCCLAILNVCKAERRSVHAKFFDTAIRREWRDLDKTFPRDADATSFFTTWGKGGGTSFYAALKPALEECAGEGKPDVIMITDGECAMNVGMVQDIENLKTKTGASVYLINVTGNKMRPESAPFADEIYDVQVDRAPNDTAAHAVFTRI